LFSFLFSLLFVSLALCRCLRRNTRCPPLTHWSTCLAPWL
jgi:hypothetical protein